MSENSWQDKGYGDYFETLSKQLNKSKNGLVKPHNEEKQNLKTVKSNKGGVFRLRKSVVAVFLAVVLVAVCLTVKGFSKSSDKTDVNTETEKTTSSVSKKEKKEKPIKIEYAFNDDTAEITLENDAKSVIVIDKQTNTVVAERNAHQKSFPARAFEGYGRYLYYDS